MPLGGLEGRMAALAAERARAMELGQIARGIGPQAEAGVAGAMQEYRAGKGEERAQAEELRRARKFKDEQYDRDQALDKDELSAAMENWASIMPDEYAIPNRDPIADYDSVVGRTAPGAEKPELSFEERYALKAQEIEGNLSPKSPKDYEPSAGLSADDFGIDADNSHTVGTAKPEFNFPERREVNVEALADLLIQNAKERNPGEEYDKDVALEVAAAHAAKIRAAEDEYRKGIYAERERRRKVQREKLEDDLKRATIASKIEATKGKIRENTLGKGPSAELFYNKTMPFVQNVMDGKVNKGLDSYSTNQQSRADQLVRSLAKEVGAEKSGGAYSSEDQDLMMGALSRRIQDNTKGFKDEGAKAFFGRIMNPGESPEKKAKKGRRPVSNLQDKAYEDVERSVNGIISRRVQLDRVMSKGIDTGKFPNMMGQVSQWFGVESVDWATANAEQRLAFVAKAREAMPGVLSNQDIQLLSYALGNDLDEDSMRAVVSTFHDAAVGQLYDDNIPKLQAYDDDGRFAPLIKRQLEKLERSGGKNKTYRKSIELAAARRQMGKGSAYVIIKKIGGGEIITNDPEGEIGKLEKAGIPYLVVTNEKMYNKKADALFKKQVAAEVAR